MAVQFRFLLVIAFAWALPLLLNGHAFGAETYRYAGATTLQQDFMLEAADKFGATHEVRFELEGGNSSAGINALIAGGIDIAGSGRFLTGQEKTAGLVEYLIGWDPLVVVVHKSNLIENISSEDLRHILMGTVFNWNQIGGRDLPLVQVAPPPSSGVHDAVEQFLLKEGQNISSQAIVSLVVADADKNVSFLPAGFTVTSRSMVDAARIKVIKVDGLLPDRVSVASGQYPLIKPLLLVTKGKARGNLALFVNFAKSPEGQAIIAKKFVPLADQ